jgi:hypothetical protein
VTHPQEVPHAAPPQCRRRGERKIFAGHGGPPPSIEALAESGGFTIMRSTGNGRTGPNVTATFDAADHSADAAPLDDTSEGSPSRS